MKIYQQDSMARHDLARCWVWKRAFRSLLICDQTATKLRLSQKEGMPMETSAEYFRRRLTDEEIIEKLRGRGSYRSRRDAALRIEELKEEVARLEALRGERQH